MMPPLELRRFVGSERPERFLRIGREMVGLLRRGVHLKPDDRVLDVGCGCGRIAIALSSFLELPGTYDGFDCHRPSIEWAQQNIGQRVPGFRFHWADIYNGEYNPEGHEAPETFRFPYEDGAFDVVVLTSVFTHLLPRDASHYLSEIARVLSPRGRVFATWFLLTEYSLLRLECGQSRVPFEFPYGSCRVSDPVRLEAVIAYPEAAVRKLYTSHGFLIEEPIRWGRWCRRPARERTFQDVVAAVRR